MQAKIRNAQLEKVPYILVMGDKEAVAGQINLRLRDNTTPGAMAVEAFIKMAQETVVQKRLL
jgi:threonyl-tRNA synthetase